VGAAAYRVERAPKASGPWAIAGDDIDESFAPYRSLFADESAPAGDWYYRVRAKNAAGMSEPSIVFGPVTVSSATVVDELADFTKVQSKEGALEIKTRDCRRAKEDPHRAAGEAGAALVYRLPTAIEGFRVFAFFPRDLADLKFSVSVDGRNYRELKVDQENYFRGAGDYGYWKPVMYHAANVGSGQKFLKIAFTGETQIGRVEIQRALEKKPTATE
jgi:hypothetical protein